MGRLMDRVMGGIDLSDPRGIKHVEKELERIQDHCQWTSGTWETLGGLRWNDIQNTPAHIRLLSNALLRAYLSASTHASS